MKCDHIVILVLYYFDAVTGLLCQECQGDPAECGVTGVTVSCQSFPNDLDSDQICSSFYTWSNGIAKVMKGCKARKSCRTNEAQNHNKCNGSELNKFCQCCCDDDNCNSDVMGCASPLQCDRPHIPSNGLVQCLGPFPLGTQCNVSCLPGYELVGRNITKCYRNTISGKLDWSNVGQRCVIPVTCQTLPPPFNGVIDCVNKRLPQLDANTVGTKCVFSCDNGYRLAGVSSVSTCLKNGLWSRPSPQCVPLQCPRFPFDANRWHACSFSSNVGSVCQFHCATGYKPVGSLSTRCTFHPGQKQSWSNPPPVCRPASCQPILSGPMNGSTSCTDSNTEGSICQTSCDYGYDIANSTLNVISATCVLNEFGTVGSWTAAPVTCDRVKCDSEPVSTDALIVNCTDFNNADSDCSFSCGEGYKLDDTFLDLVVSSCIDDVDGDSNGIWSLFPFPTCSPVTCQSLPRSSINGRIVCTDGNNFGSTCEFRCTADFDLSSKTVSSTCIQSDTDRRVGQWSNKPNCATVTSP